MGIFWDNPDSPDSRRKQDAERRRRDEDSARANRKAHELAEKKRLEQKRAEIKAQQAEDEKAIAELQKKFLGDQGHKADQAKSAMGLNRGPGLGSSGSSHRNPAVKLGSGGALPKGFNPNAPREGQENDVPSKGSSEKSAATSSGTKLPRPF